MSEPFFKVFEEFRGASYEKRYELLCKKLVRERLYDSACLVMSESASGLEGRYREPSREVGFANFAGSLIGHAISYVQTHE